jgi:NAD dependent epimerase/dehydratase family
MVCEGVRAVFHLAGLPGVRRSWGDRFSDYVACNVLGTQRLLEACVATDVPRLVFASSSSVYGPGTGKPSQEGDLPLPLSPYGVSKLAAERLCLAYASQRGAATSVVALWYFTVYGPRQRPDMAFSRIMRAALSAGRCRCTRRVPSAATSPTSPTRLPRPGPPRRLPAGVHRPPRLRHPRTARRPAPLRLLARRHRRRGTLRPARPALTFAAPQKPGRPPGCRGTGSQPGSAEMLRPRPHAAPPSGKPGWGQNTFESIRPAAARWGQNIF